jgi:hypothetical protein
MWRVQCRVALMEAHAQERAAHTLPLLHPCAAAAACRLPCAAAALVLDAVVSVGEEDAAYASCGLDMAVITNIIQPSFGNLAASCNASDSYR